MSFDTIRWSDKKLYLIDQTALPLEESYIEYTDHAEAARAITDMIVRGAPAIGVTAAYGLVLAANEIAASGQPFEPAFAEACELFAATRPTAVNLFWGIERMQAVADTMAGQEPQAIADRLEAEAVAIHEEDVIANKAMGRHGAALLPERCTILTHCNAGALATADYGTALGVIRAAVEAGKDVKVYADETRPFLQGARLTAWELMADKIDVTLICDNMAGALMQTGKVDAVVVGADRIAANGDVANKIGTYPLSIVAKAHGVPFYVAAPISTIDMSLGCGDLIPIEERDPSEVTGLGQNRVAPEGVKVWNPAFDVTPASNIAAIITERGVAKAPYTESIAALCGVDV